MAQWWEQDEVVAPAQGGAPGIIRGAPKPVDPLAVAAGERAERSDIRAAASDDRAAQAAMRAQLEWDATHNPDGTLKTKTVGGVPDLNESQAKNTGFYGAALSAEKEFGASGSAETPRGNLGTLGERVAPGIQNQFDDASRQRAQQAKENFIRASLRLESGAAIGASEFDRQNRIFFPQTGDTPEQMEQKARARQVVIDGFRLGAGAGAAEIEKKVLSLYPDEAAKGDRNELASATRRPDGKFDLVWGDGRKQVADSIPLSVGGDDAPSPDTPPSDLGNRFHMGVGDVAQAAGDTLGLIANPVNAGINSIFGTDLGTDLGQSFRNATGAPDAIKDDERLVSAINRGGASALFFGGGGGALAPALSGGARQVAGVLGANLATDTVTGASSALGGEYARQQGGGIGAQLAASIVGGGGGLGASALTSSLSSRLGRTATMPALGRLGQIEGVDVSRPMVDPALQNRVTGVEATMAGGPIVQQALGRTASQIERGIGRLGGDGDAMTANVAGQSIRNAGERFIKTTGAKASRDYDKAVALAGDTRLDATTARQQADEMISRLGETANTNSKEIAYLQGLRDDLSKPISVGALRDLRTTLRKQVAKGELTFGQNEARVLGIMDALSGDINSGLTAAGKADAAKAFTSADKSYRDRMDVIGGTIQKLLGKRGAERTPETVFTNFRNMATPKGDERGFSRMLDMMKPDERADIAATFADELGKNPKGEFSTAYLTTQAGKLPEAARKNVFGEEGAQSLNNLIQLAKAHERVTGGLNKSRTGVANDWRSMLGNLVFGGGAGLYSGNALTGLAAGATGMAAKTGRDFLSAKALMSTDLTKWMRSMPASTDPAALSRHMAQLANISAKNPAINVDIQALQQAIAKVANDNVSAAAASGSNQQDNR